MAKEEKTLSEQDRKRIDRKISDLYNKWTADDVSIIDLLRQVAEYEHKYQREQQVDIMRGVESLARERNKDSDIMHHQAEKIQQLEAERTELINEIKELKKRLDNVIDDKYENLLP